MLLLLLLLLLFINGAAVSVGDGIHSHFSAVPLPVSNVYLPALAALHTETSRSMYRIKLPEFLSWREMGGEVRRMLEDTRTSAAASRDDVLTDVACCHE